MFKTKSLLRDKIYDFVKNENNFKKLQKPDITNANFWFSSNVFNNLNIIKYFIEQIQDNQIKQFFLVPFSETIRDCSYTRNNEFKLYKMKSEDILKFNPDVFGIYFNKLNNVISIYINTYFPKLNYNILVDIQYSSFKPVQNKYDIVLTSPPYGDSKTTVAYGQFSTFSNEWLGFKNARMIDKLLMGGKKSKSNITTGLIAHYISNINKNDSKRALEISSFYNDLDNSIKKISQSIKKGGKSIYIVGNRTVKNVQLPTDQFIAEKFEENGFKHLITYERLLSNKNMPSKNSPTNKIGKTSNTMLYEYIVICEKYTENIYNI